jgi:HD-GYP domain-containing protein (c-di-GMP phosphodiesterase class II)
MFAVVDTVDSMTSYRPYREPLPLETALEEVERNAGKQFDPRCAENFLALDREDVALRLQHSPEFRFPRPVAVAA